MEPWMEGLQKSFPRASLEALDIFLEEGSLMSLEAWAKSFCKRPRVGRLGVVGYSLGGRLGLNAWLTDPDIFELGIFLSTNMGFASTDLDLRKQRLQGDDEWSERFKKEDWNSLMRSWNQQEVFRFDKDRTQDLKEGDFDRTKLARSLQSWSLGHQRNFLDELEKIKHKKLILVCGEKDNKYALQMEFAKKRHPWIKTIVVPNHGHRVFSTFPPEVQDFLAV